MMCPCGKPLHYKDEKSKKMVQSIIDKFGEDIKVVVLNKEYLVNRHYIALHGIKASELEKLADKGKVKRL